MKFRSLVPMYAGLFLLAACGSKFHDYCTQRAQCVGGNDKDIQACIATAEGAQNEASAYGCSDAANKLADCLNNKATCHANAFTADCNNEEQALSSCECAASTTCGKNGTPGGPVAEPGAGADEQVEPAFPFKRFPIDHALPGEQPAPEAAPAPAN